MKLATQYFYVNNGVQFQGIFCTITVREFDQFIIKCELYKFKTADPVILKTIEQECEKNSTRIEILNKIDSDLLAECSLTYHDVETYRLKLYGDIRAMESNNPDPVIRYNLDIYSKINVAMNLQQAKRFYNNLHMFYTDYMLLENMFKMIVLAGQTNAPPKPKQVTEYAKNAPTQPVAPKPPPPPPPNNKTGKPSILDGLMKFGVNNVIGSSVIHFMFNYFRYVSKDVCFVEFEEGKATIICPSILPGNYLFDTPYFKSLINSIVNVDVQHFSYYISKLVNSVVTKKELYESPLYIMMIAYLNLIYSLRYMHDTHTGWLYDNIDNVISDPVRQTKILNHHINQHVKCDISVQYEIRDVDVFEYESEEYIEDIKNVSDEHAHLIPVDQRKFVDIVLQKVEDQQREVPDDFCMGRKKVLDLNNLQKDSARREKGKRRGELFSTDKLTPELSNEILEANLIHYDFKSEDQLLTEPYRCLMKYIHDPSTIMLVKDEVVPKVVRKLFETLKTILTPGVFDKDEMNTLHYYRTLCKSLPEAKILSHTTLLYIVFQIIIPYYVDVNKVKTFNDQLLI